jgi:hypothetical protein
VALLTLPAALAVGAPASRADGSPSLNVWVHYDYMVGQGYSDAPSPAAIEMVVDAFGAHGVTLHIDPQHTAIPAHQVIVPDWQSNYAATPGFDSPSCTGPDAVLFSALKAQYFHPSSNHPWHYAVFGNYVFGNPSTVQNCPPTFENGNAPPEPGMTGDSQLGWFDVQNGLGYDFIVALQRFRDIGVRPTDMNVAGLFMHELGHNLGLSHDGNPTDPVWSLVNYAPNYLSVMNYWFMLHGIPYASTPGSTTVVGHRLDYSDVKLPDLYTNNLDETVGLQDTAHPTDVSYFFANGGATIVAAAAIGPIDWNQDGNTTDMHVTADITNSGSGLGTSIILAGSDDWAWIHARLTPPAITDILATSTHAGGDIELFGVNLIAPVTVVFTGGATASASAELSPGGQMTTFLLQVAVPAGAKSGQITVITPEGKATSSQSLTITP